MLWVNMSKSDQKICMCAFMCTRSNIFRQWTIGGKVPWAPVLHWAVIYHGTMCNILKQLIVEGNGRKFGTRGPMYYICRVLFTSDFLFQFEVISVQCDKFPMLRFSKGYCSHSLHYQTLLRVCWSWGNIGCYTGPYWAGNFKTLLLLQCWFDLSQTLYDK